jgi:hypothetical protein
MLPVFVFAGSTDWAHSDAVDISPAMQTRANMRVSFMSDLEFFLGDMLVLFCIIESSPGNCELGVANLRIGRS